MRNHPAFQKLKRILSRCGPLLLLCQRSPLVQMLFPQANLLASSAVMNSTGFAIATVVGLGAFDSVAGATVLSQVLPVSGSITVPVTAGVSQAGKIVFQVTGSPSSAQSWSVSNGTLPTGLTLTNNNGSTTTVTGTTTQIGDRIVRIRAWEHLGFTGNFIDRNFTFRVTAPAAITTHPASTTITSGSTTILTVVATGTAPLTYQWFQGESGVTTTPVGTNLASYTTPALSATTSYWVRVTNPQNTTGAFSNTATVTVGVPAAIDTQPVSTTINSGQSTQLSVVASGDAPLTYQWYQGNTGNTATPVGTDSPNFTTPNLTSATSYWVRVSNLVNPTGVDSVTATVSIAQPAAIVTHPASTTINSGQSTQLSVVASGDAPLTYQWYQGASGDTGTLVGTDANTFTTPNLTATTSYWVKVTNAANLTGANSNAATVTVRQPAAITTHPASTTINSGQSTQLSVVASGDEPFTYQWYQGASGVTTTPVGTDSNSFTTPVLTATTSYWVKVTNAANLTGSLSNTATVTVRQPAAITTHPVSTFIGSGATSLLSVSATGDAPLTYQWYQGASGVTTTPVGTDSNSFTTPALTATTSYWVKVTNAANLTGANSDTATVTVLPATPSSAHAMSLNAGLVTPSTRGNSGTTWFGWETFNEPGARAQPIDDSTPDIGTTSVGANFQTTNAQDHVLDNGDLEFGSGTLAEQITVPTSGMVGMDGFTTLVLQIASTPGSGAFPAPITLGSINGVAPNVVQALNSAGDGQLWATWELPGNQASYTLTLTGPAAQADFSFDRVVVDTQFSLTSYLADTMAAVPPGITTTSPLPLGVVGVAYSQQLVGSGGHAPYEFSVAAGSLPAGLTLSGSGLLSGTPTTAGLSEFTLLISDANLLSTTKEFALTATTMPGITTASPLPVGVVDGAYSQQLVGSGGTEPYTYLDSVGSLPAGLTLSTGGLLSGTPTGTVAASFTVEITDANDLTATKDFALTVTTAPGFTTASPLPIAVVNEVYSLQLVGNGGTAPYGYLVSAGSLPSGVTLSAGGLLSGTPTGTGAAAFTVRITDANNLNITKDFALSVTTRPVIGTASPLATALVGVPFNVTLAAAGGTTPYVWSFDSGALPEGLDFSSNGVLSGTPTTVGTSTFTVQVQDANGLTDSETFSLTLSDLTITTTSLPTAVKGVAFAHSLTGTGAGTPHTWFKSAGTLPVGITLSGGGVLFGTTTVPGTYPFTARLTDNSGFAVTKELTLTVSASFLAPVIEPIDFPRVTVGEEFSYTITALNYPKTFTITGLPKGLKFTAGTGAITGRPDVSGLFSVQVRATNTGGTSATVTAPLTVMALDPNLVGAFTGITARNAINRSLGGTLTVTTTSLGGFSVKYLGAIGSSTASASASATGRMAATAPQITAPLGGQTLTLTINPLTGGLTGNLGTAPISGWRSVWNAAAKPASTLEGYYSFALDLADVDDVGEPTIPQGSGFATFIVSPGGNVTVTGKTADGESITGASLLGANGEFGIYSALYKNLGSILGQLTLSEDAGSIFTNNTVAGTLTWFKPDITGRAYPIAFGPLNLTAEGAYLAPTSKGNAILGLPAPGSVLLGFTDGGLLNSDTDPDLTFTFTSDNKVVLPTAPGANPGKVALTLSAATGAVSGSYTLTEPAPLPPRSKIPFIGQVVRLADGSVKAVGYHLVPQIPTGGGQTAANAPILSGGFTLRSVPPATYSLPTAVKDLAFNHSLIGPDGAPPFTWEVTAGTLPAGITLSTAGVLSGTPLAAGTTTFSVTRTDDNSDTVILALTLTVSPILVPPVILPVSFPAGTIGAEFTHTVNALHNPKTFTITGLPKGLKFATTTGIITGRPDVSGLFSVQVRATNAAGVSATVTAPLTVMALNPNLVGAFTGLTARNAINRSLGGTLTVTTTSLGGFSVKYLGAIGSSTASASASATGRMAATAPQITAPLGGQTLTLTINPLTGGLTGNLGTAPISGWRSVWNASAKPASTLEGYYSFALDLADVDDVGEPTIPQGSGFATFIVSPGGNVTVTGKTADGESITGASLLGANGEFGIYSALYKNLGSILGQLALSEDAAAIFADNTVAGTLTWFKPDITGRAYPVAFGPLNLTAEGAYLAPTSKGNAILGLPPAGNVLLGFTDGGLLNSDTNPNVTFTFTSDNKVVLPTAPGANPGKVALTLSAATGAVSGSYTLVETAPPLTRAKVPFVGQVVRLADGTVKAVGYHLVPQIPTGGGQTAANAPILSGGFTLTPE